MNGTVIFYALPIPAALVAGVVPELTVGWAALLAASPLLVPAYWALRHAVR